MLAFVALLAPLPAASDTALRPNIVLILLDDVGYGDLGAYGGTYVRTPTLDALAADGMRFTEYHSNGPVCTPSRAAILTGHYPIRLGLRDALRRGTQRGIPPDVETLADRLRAAGYATGHFGKWHLGSLPEYRPTRRGFERSVVTAGTGTDPTVSFDDAPAVATAGHATEIVTDQAVAFVVANRDRPFFANVWYTAAHTPYEPPAEWAVQYPDEPAGRYAAALSHADAQIGRLLGELGRLGLDARTLVLVASDNGGVNRAIATNGSLRGAKRDVFEGGVRVPLIARWTGRVAAGSVNSSFALGIDFLPTLCDLAGVPAGPGLPGRSLVAALLSGQVIRGEETVFWETADAVAAFDAAPEELYAYAARRADWKLVRESAGEAGAPMLFDLVSDPGETTDLAAEHPELVADLERAYRLWRARESRIDAPVARSSGAAAHSGAWMRFSDGVIEVAADSRFHFHDGDFAFRVRVMPLDLATEQVLAAQPGSWSLVLLPAGSLKLTVRGEQGQTVELESASRLWPGVASDVAFSVFGRRFGAAIRLFVDGRLVAESHEPDAVRVAQGAVRIGNGAAGARPFRGLLWEPRFHAASLAPADLADLDFDGIPNAADDCIGVPDGPLGTDRGGNVQRDSDGDAIGSACDPDLNGDGIVAGPDWLALIRALGARRGEPGYSEALDFDGDGTVGFPDLLTLERAHGMPPGPSGLVCTPEAPCTGP